MTTMLAEMVAAQLGVGRVELLTSVAEVAPYDLEALTTAGRFWVHGKARCGDTTMPYRFFVKVVQSWERSPFFAFVPTELREVATRLGAVARASRTSTPATWGTACRPACPCLRPEVWSSSTS